MERATSVRMILRMRAAASNGTTLTLAANGVSAGSCTIAAGAWTDCRVEIPASVARAGINELTMIADSVSPPADHPGDARELSFVMQGSRVRVGG